MPHQHPNTHMAVGLEGLETRLKELIQKSADEIFYIRYQLQAQECLLCVDNVNKKVLFDDKLGRPMSPMMQNAIQNGLGYLPTIIDIAKVERHRDIYAANVATISKDWEANSRRKFQDYLFKNTNKRRYGIFVESNRTEQSVEERVTKKLRQ